MDKDYMRVMTHVKEIYDDIRKELSRVDLSVDITLPKVFSLELLGFSFYLSKSDYDISHEEVECINYILGDDWNYSITKDVIKDNSCDFDPYEIPTTIKCVKTYYDTESAQKLVALIIEFINVYGNLLIDIDLFESHIEKENLDSYVHFLKTNCI